MENTIWKNEKNTLDKIAAEAREHAEIKRDALGYMSKSGNLRNNQRSQQAANIYGFRNSNNEFIILMENSSVLELNYTYDRNSNNQVSVVYDKKTEQIAYYLHSGAKGHNLLALVSQENAEFPIYGNDRDGYAPLLKLQQIGKLPAGEQKTTVRETIEKTLLDNPELKEEAYAILAGFDQILSVDKERQIQPFSPIEIENAQLKDKVEEMSDEIVNSKRTSESQKAEIAKLKEEIAHFKNENSILQEENAGQKTQIRELQTMLSESQTLLRKTLEFITKVRDSVVGKVFFKKPLQELEVETQALPEGEER